MRKMSGQDAAFLYGETSNWHLHVSGLMIVDAASAPDGWTFERFREILISRMPEVPQLRWRYVDVPERDYTTVGSIYFTDPKHGLVLAFRTGGPVNVALLRTNNGGRSWQRVRLWPGSIRQPPG